MGLSPSQGHNNLRLYHTTPYYHSHRLDDTKHNLHILHKLQSNSNSKCSNRSNNRQSKRQRSPKNARFSAERPRYLFEQSDGLHKSQPNFNNFHSDSSVLRSNQRYLRKSFPLLSNLPFINRDTSIVMINHSPFGLRDPRFGIFHHCSQSVSYF